MSKSELDAGVFNIVVDHTTIQVPLAKSVIQKKRQSTQQNDRMRTCYS